MKICIVGTGWYGCHLASVCVDSGHVVDIFERSDFIFSGASGNNQNRLHLGFHYPRDFETRMQSKLGFSWFLDKYAKFTSKIQNNYYAVSQENSFVDFETYKQIMTASELIFNVCQPKLKLSGLEGVIEVQERLIDTTKARQHFAQVLSSHVNFMNTVDLSTGGIEYLRKNYDLIIDCTWRTNEEENLQYYFEPCIYFQYRKLLDIDFALTVMDGPFFSLYPVQDCYYSLTSVKDGPLGQYSSFLSAQAKLNEVKHNPVLIKQKRNMFESLVLSYYPQFFEHFDSCKVRFGIKTKPVSSTDKRSTRIEYNNNVLRVFSGKIDTIYIAESRLREVWS